jgi:hypothetical protein
MMQTSSHKSALSYSGQAVRPVEDRHDTCAANCRRAISATGTSMDRSGVIRLDDVFLKPSRPSRGRQGPSGVRTTI